MLSVSQVGQFCDLHADLRSSTCFHDSRNNEYGGICGGPCGLFESSESSEWEDDDDDANVATLVLKIH